MLLKKQRFLKYGACPDTIRVANYRGELSRPVFSSTLFFFSPFGSTGGGLNILIPNLHTGNNAASDNMCSCRAFKNTRKRK